MKSEQQLELHEKIREKETSGVLPGHLSISKASIESIHAMLTHLRQDNAEFIFWVRTSKAERHLYVSPSYETIWQRSRDSLYKNPDSFLSGIHNQDREEFEKHCLNYRNEKPKSLEKSKMTLMYPNSNISVFRINTAGGEPKWIEDYGFDLYDTSGNKVAITGFSKIISEEQGIKLKGDNTERILEKMMLDNYMSSLRSRFIMTPAQDPNINLFGSILNNVLYIDNREVALTKRESECLDLLIKDYSIKEIGKSLNISPRTVESYLQNVKAKTDSRSNLSLVSRVVMLTERYSVN